MSNVVKFTMNNVPAGLDSMYVRVEEDALTQGVRNVLYSGVAPVSGNAIEVNIGENGVVGNGAIVSADNYTLGGAAFKAISGYSLIEAGPIETFPIDDVVIFGASIMAQSFTGANQQVTEQLYATKGANVTVHERATSGDTSTVMKSRLPALITEFQANAARTLFVIHWGGNDVSQGGEYPAAADIMDTNCREMLQDLKAAGFKIALSNITYRIPPASNPTDPYNQNVMNLLIDEFADIALDMHSLTFDNQGTWFEVDKIHPNLTGEDMNRNYIVDKTYIRFSNLGPIPESIKWQDVVLQFGLADVYPDSSNEFSIDATKSSIKNVDLTVVEGASVTLSGSVGHSDTFGRGNVNDPSDTSISLTNNSGLKSYTYKQDGAQTVDLSAANLEPAATYTVGVTASRESEDVRNNDVTVGGITKVMQATASPAEIVEFTNVSGSDLIANGIVVAPTGGTGYSYISMIRITKTA